jgi:hypothetical protein
MYELNIYGASDDLIEVDGDITEEFGYHDDRDAEEPGCFLAISDGTLLHIVYGQGSGAFWRITVRSKGPAFWAKHEATDEETDYSDKITLKSEKPFMWVLKGDTLNFRPLSTRRQKVG